MTSSCRLPILNSNYVFMCSGLAAIFNAKFQLISRCISKPGETREPVETDVQETSAATYATSSVPQTGDVVDPASTTASLQSTASIQLPLPTHVIIVDALRSSWPRPKTSTSPTSCLHSPCTAPMYRMSSGHCPSHAATSQGAFSLRALTRVTRVDDLN